MRPTQPATHTATHPDKYNFKHFSTNVYQESIQEYIQSRIGRRPQLFKQMEDNLNFLGKWKTTSIFRQMEDNLNY